jgi:hypothetical protein
MIGVIWGPFDPDHDDLSSGSRRTMEIVMPHRSDLTFSIVTIALTALAFSASLGALRAGEPQTAQSTALTVPASIHAEHEHIHTALVALTKTDGAVGTAATELAEALHPHFVREEEIALPPLGLLAPLAAGKTPAGMDEAAVMSETLKREMPRMLEEHKVIRTATANLMRVGKQEGHAGAQEFATALAAHATTEEEILYPAAILVGDVIRARSGKR